LSDLLAPLAVKRVRVPCVVVSDVSDVQLYSACFAWGLHWVVARLLLRALNVPSVAWSELLAYTGYPFVMICLTIIAGFLAGEWLMLVAMCSALVLLARPVMCSLIHGCSRGGCILAGMVPSGRAILQSSCD
jgi:hypothetical protein